MLLSSCGEPDNASLYGYFSGPDAPKGAITSIEIDGKDCMALKAGGATLAFKEEKEKKYGVYFYASNGDLIAYNNEPAKISVRGVESFGMYETHDYYGSYDSVLPTRYGYHCIAIVKTKASSEFRIMDSYFISEEYGITVNRKVTVIKARSADVGYESLYTLKNGSNLQSVDDFDFFIPSCLYKDTKYNASTALITNLYNAQMYVKETRMGLPMTMIYNRDNGYYYLLVHANPKIDVHGEISGGSDGAVDDDLEYASLGFESESNGEPTDIALTFCYPCAEGPATFDSGAGWAKRFSNVAERHCHEYQVGLVFGNTETFNDALVDSYEKSYLYVDAEVEKYSNEICYQQNIDCFTAEYTEITKNGVTSYGVPWELNVDPKEDRGNYSYEMGFVGQQTSVGAHLYRQGLDKHNSTYKTQGKNIVNFWTSSTIYPSSNVFPYIWWEGSAGGLHTQGSMSYAVIYLRMLCDGVEGILDAYLYGKSYGEENTDWLNYCIRFANNLVSKQNDDGSFNRAFTREGGIPDSKAFADKNIGYDSNDPDKFKINTPVAIRFLCKMYEVTENEIYKEAARKAADYSYENIYVKMGKYVGGTCDNANVVDKEAAIFAMFGFRAAYALFGEKKYEKAMRHAACCSLSWTIMYDFACPANESDKLKCPYTEGNVLGVSIIATGHASVDGFSCYMWFDLYEVYRLTGCETYKKAAITLQNATKAFTDFDGSRGWRYKCLMVEACQVSDFLFKPTNEKGSLWLPWCAVAQINPIIYTFQKYGVYQLEDIVEE